VGGSGQWRVRTGHYRILYEVEDEQPLVLVLRLGDVQIPPMLGKPFLAGHIAPSPPTRAGTKMGSESGPEAGVKGVVEDAKGKAKEAFGVVAGNDSLKHEGQAQQDKATAQRDVATKEAQAEKARAAASAAEADERSHQH
jgi:uncharacterized protein YjbJ (UPF0337 family)